MPEIDTPITPSAPDPGTPASRVVATLAAVFLFLGLAVLQSWPSEPQPPAPEAAVGIESINPQADLAFRMVIKMSGLFASDPGSLKVMASWAHTPTERVYLAVAIGEVQGPQAALDHLEQARAADDDEQLRADIAVLDRVYRAAAAGREPDLDDAERRGIEDRHGYYARVALTYPLPEADPQRQTLRRGGGAILGMVLGVIVIGGAVLLGFTLFIVAIVLLSLRRIRPRFARPAPGGSVFLETFALFVGAFLCLKLAGMGVVLVVGPDAERWIVHASIIAQWLLLLVPLWPLLRGMPARDWRLAIGLHAGRGLFREMGLGVLTYLAAVPLYLGALALVLLLLFLRDRLTGAPGEPPSNPMVDLASSADTLLLVLFFLTATIWAPLCEELIFRGALYRHLRGFMPGVGAALLSGALFAFMHSYGPLLTPPLIALGFVFCMMREWRGSLVASMTAHTLHNGTTLVLLFSLLKALGEG